MNPFTIIPPKRHHESRHKYSLDYDNERESADYAYTEGWNACREAMWKSVQESYRKALDVPC